MRIVQVITRPQRRGAEIFALQLSEKLMGLGHEVTVFSLFQGDYQFDYPGKMIRLNLPQNGKMDISGFRVLAKALKEINPDIVQANASETLRMTVGAQFFYRGRFKLIYRNANQMSQFIKNVLQKNWNRFLLNQLDGIASVSQSSMDDLIRTFGFDKPIIKIPIGIYPEQITESILSPSELSIEGPYLLNMGAWVPEKNQSELIEIYSKSLKKEFSSLKLVLMGSGKEESNLRSLIAQHQLNGDVILVPNQVNPFSILKGAKALVLPSKIEGLPAVILEAMYCKVPVVAYGVGGIPEILKNGKTGFCIAPNDQEGFISAVEEVMEMDAELKAQLLSNAYHLVTTEYTLEKVAAQFEDFYSKLLLGLLP